MSMNFEKHPLHLKNPELQKTDEVQESVSKQERLNERALETAREVEKETGEPIDKELFDIKIPNDPTERINIYMDRMEKIFLNPDQRVRQRNIKMLKPFIYDAFIIKPEEVPESYFELQQRVLREQGIEAEVIPEQMKKEMIDTVIKDQTHSLDQWIEYLSSDDAVYPTWFKYIVFQNITKLSQFDKALGKFKERTDTTVAPYPDVYREPLAQICDIYEQVAGDNSKLKDPQIQQAFTKKFPKLYAELITESLAASMEGREEIKGEWVKYSQGSTTDAEKLFKSLEGKGTGWCTAGKSTSDTQIKSGDFYVYYTYNTNNEPTQPRIAIRMNGTNTIGEVRGTLQHQALEPQMNDILETKLEEFGPEADKYKKKTEDMRKMTEIETKTKSNEALSKADLEFLYEINSSIEGFGYQKDPRVEEIRTQRNLKEDLPVLFECESNQIATNINEINQSTQVYVGEWNINIYKQIKNHPNITHLYESFPDKKIFMQTLETDPSIQTPGQAEAKIKEKGMNVSDYARDILYKTEFSGEGKQYEIVSFSVEQLGFKGNATLKDIYAKAIELGLEICPAEVGLLLRLQYENQPNGEYLRIAMNPISDRGGNPSLFNVRRSGGKLWLNDGAGDLGLEWDGNGRFVFLSSKS